MVAAGLCTWTDTDTGFLKDGDTYTTGEMAKINK